MNIQIAPFSARGTLRAQPSKSYMHRLLICAALADRPTEIRFSGWNDDLRATAACLRALGAKLSQSEDGVTVTPLSGRPVSGPLLDCGESASTLRFLLPVASALGGASFTGRERLAYRPVRELIGALSGHGTRVSHEGHILSLSGGLTGGCFSLPGNISSQYFTGLMLAAPLLGETVIHIEGRLESYGYIEMTRAVMALFGVRAEVTEREIVIPGGQRCTSPGTVCPEGDWSAAAFALALGALSGPVTVRGLRADSLQGDRRILPVLQRMGARVETEGDAITVRAGDAMRPADEDVSDIPDLAPALAALLMHAPGESRLLGAGRLRFKESDRLSGLRDLVNALGGRAETEGDQLLIRGASRCAGGTALCLGDHRLAMAAAVAASRCLGPSVITDAQAVRKSWPGFWQDISALGGTHHVIDIRE